MKAKIFNIALALVLLMQGFCFAKNDRVTILDPATDVHVVRSPMGVMMVIDSKTGRIHLKSKDIDILMDDPGVPETATCSATAKAITQQIQDQNISDNDADNKIKNYSKTYTANAGTKLDINNRYGKVTVHTWNKNEFKVDVQIKVSANQIDDTDNLLKSITVTDSKLGQVVSFKTNFHKFSQFAQNDDNNSRKVEINYVVYMPAKNTLSITNRLGDIELPDLAGQLTINCTYGNLAAKSLSNPNNRIKITYGDARIASLRANDLDITSGSLVLGWADKLNADMIYTSAKIGKISTSGIINVKYGSGVEITNIDKNLKSLLVNSNYSTVTVGLNNAENADFDVTVKYGNFTYDNRPVKMAKSAQAEDKAWNPTQNFKGHLGKGDIEKRININSAYSSVRFD
jgi:hypothetical protein